MARRNRETLKSFFKKGEMPTEEHFRDLIDSTVNVFDETTAVNTLRDEIKVALAGNSSNILSVFEDAGKASPEWVCQLDRSSKNLTFAGSSEQPVLVLDNDNRVGIGTSAPTASLDVEGVIASHGQVGTFRAGSIPADGKWHPIVSDLEGCHAFQVMAGIGDQSSNRYALMMASAINVMGRKKKIGYLQSRFWVFFRRIKLRWTSQNGKYALEIKVRGKFPASVELQYQVSRLWFDPFMNL